MYSIAEYGAMIADSIRMDAFARGLRAAVKPGAVVVDIGTGTGIFALLACRFGAKRVYAIEPDDAIHVAREIAKANGLADRIEFIQAQSTAVTLPEKADVIVSDIGGIVPWFQHHIPSIVDARRRFLAPHGALIPQADTVWAAVVDAPELYARQTGPWRSNAYELNMEAAHHMVANTINKARISREQALTSTVRWATLDYSVAENENVRAQVTWRVDRPGTGHGFVAGFDRIVFDDIRLSNAPDAPESIRPQGIYGTLYFPWLDPVALSTGDRVTVDLEATLVGADYIWKWRTCVREHGTDLEKASLLQSTFFGAPLAPAQLRKRAADYRPQLTEEGRIARFILEAMTGGAPLAEIARTLSAEFGGRFQDPRDALAVVGDLSQRYG